MSKSQHISNSEAQSIERCDGLVDHLQETGDISAETAEKFKEGLKKSKRISRRNTSNTVSRPAILQVCNALWEEGGEATTKELAKKIPYTERHVRNVMDELEEAEFVEYVRDGNYRYWTGDVSEILLGTGGADPTDPDDDHEFLLGYKTWDEVKAQRREYCLRNDE